MKYVILILLSFMSLSFCQDTTFSSENGAEVKVDSLTDTLNTSINISKKLSDFKLRIDLLEKIKIPDSKHIYTSGSQIKSSVVLGLMGYGAITVGFLIQLNDDDGSLNKPVIGLNLFGFVCGIVSIFKLYDSGVHLERAGVKSKKPIEKEKKRKEKNGDG